MMRESEKERERERERERKRTHTHTHTSRWCQPVRHWRWPHRDTQPPQGVLRRLPPKLPAGAIDSMVAPFKDLIAHTAFFRGDPT